MTNPTLTSASGRGTGLLVGLLALCVVPVAAGAYRLEQLASGAAVTVENARFFASPVPVVVHIVTASVFSVLGALQLWPAGRRRWPGWHRRAGRVLVPCGLAAALSGLWMTVRYPWPPGDGPLLATARLVVGVAMAASLVAGARSAVRRDWARHGAWMLRAYALGLGAGTQVLTNLPIAFVAGPPPELPRAFLMALGWALNLAVAEWWIRGGAGARRQLRIRPVS